MALRFSFLPHYFISNWLRNYKKHLYVLPHHEVPIMYSPVGMLPLLWSRDGPTWKKWHSSEYVVTSTRNKTWWEQEITEFSWTYQCEAFFKLTLQHINNYCLENSVSLGGKKGRFKPGGKSVFGFISSFPKDATHEYWICFWLFTKLKSQYMIKRVEQNLSWYQFCAALLK